MESFLWPAADAFVRFHDLPGREPALILIHGLGASAAQAFVDVCRSPALSDRRCVAPDLLGFGHSDHPTGFSYSIEDHAASVAALLDDLGLRGVSVLGHSMGGAVAIVLARTRPDLVALLLLAEGHLDPVPGVVSGPIAAQSESDFVRHGHVDLTRTFVSQGFATYAGAFQVADPAAIHRTAVSLIAAAVRRIVTCSSSFRCRASSSSGARTSQTPTRAGSPSTAYRCEWSPERDTT